MAQAKYSVGQRVWCRRRGSLVNDAAVIRSIVRLAYGLRYTVQKGVMTGTVEESELSLRSTPHEFDEMSYKCLRDAGIEVQE